MFFTRFLLGDIVGVVGGDLERGRFACKAVQPQLCCSGSTPACAFAYQLALSHPFNSIDISSSLLQAKI
jgi:hypothetical protein